MPQHDQHSARDGVSQVQGSAEHCWDDLVQQRLPAKLEAQARALGAFQRVRALPSAQALLRAILCYVLSLSSLKQLSGWSRLVGVSSKVLSAQAWHKRLQRCGPWLLWLCTALLDLRLTTGALPTGQRILLVDATFLNEMGAKGDLWRLHCAYDLLGASWPGSRSVTARWEKALPTCPSTQAISLSPRHFFQVRERTPRMEKRQPALV
jgi:hypothetical protein